MSLRASEAGTVNAREGFKFTEDAKTDKTKANEKPKKPIHGLRTRIGISLVMSFGENMGVVLNGK